MHAKKLSFTSFSQFNVFPEFDRTATSLKKIMKRKLDENNVPASAVAPSLKQTELNFKTFGLDSRLLQAIAKEGFTAPTQVQSRVIPLALQGKDILGIIYSASLPIALLTSFI